MTAMEKDSRVNPNFWSKVVYILECKACGEEICRRGMRAILLADTSIALFSTDTVDASAIGVVPNVFTTTHCSCKIQNIACRCCGSVVGYHVLTPCKQCMRSCNNGHFWMFHSNCVQHSGRISVKEDDYLLWKEIPRVEDDDDILGEECIR